MPDIEKPEELQALKNSVAGLLVEIDKLKKSGNTEKLLALETLLKETRQELKEAQESYKAYRKDVKPGLTDADTDDGTEPFSFNPFGIA